MAFIQFKLDHKIPCFLCGYHSLLCVTVKISVNSQMAVAKLSLTIGKYEIWFSQAQAEVTHIRSKLEELETNLHCPDVTLHLKSEITSLRNQVKNWPS